jgi:hypothetical protein
VIKIGARVKKRAERRNITKRKKNKLHFDISLMAYKK